MSDEAGSPRLLARVRGPESDVAFAVTDAACWVAVLRRPGTAGDTVGTFRASCSSVEADAALEAARRALAAQHDGESGDVGWSIDLDGRSVLVSHGTAVDEGLDAAVDPLIARALASPVAAVRLEAHVVDVPGMGAMLGFTFASLGTEPTSLRFDADRFQVTDAAGSAFALPAPSLGLVDGDGTLRDGLHATAELPADRRATCSFPLGAAGAGGEDAGDDERGGLVGADLLGAALSGSIALAGPWSADGIQPFTAQASVQTVPKGALG
ncbi:hypothetical protein [Agromyces aureus]|uniref:Uncharacterized protein n=1 Tax=Agromyces aureus TaxID=453304 RepID=A0A191WBR5_9MICO|nr:hypothetical protein [Agromyces aureus]ANJ25700.1 hypothetical protein ATC03_01910 [Agromyces aureus]